MQLPNILNQNTEKIILCFSIIVTGRCNANCSYCHFFATRNRQNIGYNISDKLFDTYVSFLSGVKRILPANIELQCRFSGGEPLLLGDRLFKLARRIYQSVSIKPFILTNGALINKEFIDAAKQNPYINFLYVSLENPLEPDRGAFNPEEIMKKMMKYNSKRLPIIPAVAVINNEHFKNLYKICRIFYKKLRCLPTISELNYSLFTSPTKKQLEELYENVFKIVKFFHLKTAIKLFPYISPELCYGGFPHYIIELNLENKYGLTKNNINRKLIPVLNQLKKSYPELHCKHKDCDWYNDCKWVKWVWKEGFGKINPSEKIKNYCEMKKIISVAFFEALKSFK